MWYSPARSNKTMQKDQKPGTGGENPTAFFSGVVTALLISLNLWVLIYFAAKYIYERWSQ